MNKKIVPIRVLLRAVVARKAKPLARLWGRAFVPAPALAEARREKETGGLQDQTIDDVLEAGLQWLTRAQDNSCDGGVAHSFTLGKGWNPSYPETTGYIIPTLIREAHLRRDDNLLGRTRTMLDWLVGIQMPCGGFQGGMIGSTPVVPVTFNTGQILIGLAGGVREFGDVYLPAMRRAADWLVSTQDPDGCWREYPTPFARLGEKVYETHTAAGLIEAARVKPHSAYADAAMRNIRWALSHQRSNGWFAQCCLTDPDKPLTHTIGYALQGIVQAHRFLGDRTILEAARKTADGILEALHPNGFLPGRLDANWKGAVSWACLTGSAQIAQSWLMIYQDTGDKRYRDAAYLANKYVRSTIQTTGPDETRGGVKGSFPAAGEYYRYQYPNWACKFSIDSNRLEKAIREEEECADVA